MKITSLSLVKFAMLPVLAGPLHAASWLDFSNGVTGWTTAGNVTVFPGTDSFTIDGGEPYSLSPAEGENMVRILPGGAADLGSAGLNTLLNLPVGTINSSVGAAVTNVAYIQRSITLDAGTYNFSWAYAANDYQPYNDGILFGVTGEGVSLFRVLARNGTGGDDTSGPFPATLVVGSYGATSWQTVSFDVVAGGTYTMTFAAYNWDDSGMDPVLYVAGSAGSFTGEDLAPPTLGSIPEPSASAALAGLLAIGGVAMRRKHRA